MKHTPTPWRIEDGTTLIWGSCNPEDNTDAGMGYPVTECRTTPISASSWCKAPYSEEGEANAAHIVKCVNMHDELVEALKLANGFISMREDKAGLESIAGKNIRAVLKKAGAL